MTHIDLMIDAREYLITPCRHGVYLDKYECKLCDLEDERRTCPVCLCGNADKLSMDGYACDKCKNCVWYVEPNGDKVYFTEHTTGEVRNGKYLPEEVVTPTLLEQFGRGV